MVSTKLKNMLEQEIMYSVLLSHRPELFETYVACGVDLVLSGHEIILIELQASDAV